jgi:amino acid adenylation domain-containing protein
MVVDRSESAGPYRAESHQNAIYHSQRHALQALVRHALTYSPFYRDYYGAHGIKETDLSDIAVEDLPNLSKQTLMENFDNAITDSRFKRKDLEHWIKSNPDPAKSFHDDIVVIHSSGSSGSVGTFVYDQKAWQMANSAMASRLPLPENYPLGRTRAAFYLASHGHFGGVSTAARMPKTVYDTLIISLRDSREQVTERLNAFQPHRLQGYASSIAVLAEMALDGRLRINPKCVFVSGDKLSDAMENTIREAWRAPVYNLYSASESKCIAIRKPYQREMIVVDDLNIVEVLDDNDQAVATGKTGRVVLTNLYNYLLPVLRYELGDYVEAGMAANVFGFSTLRDIGGRINTSLPIVLDDGSRDSIHPMLLEDFQVPGLETIQFISLKPDQVQIKYVAPADLDAAVSREFQQLLAVKNAALTTFMVERAAEIAADPWTGKATLVRILDDSPARMRTRASSESPCAPQTTAAANVCGDRDSEQFEQSIANRFEAVVRQHGNRLAIQSESQGLTYDELNRAANRLARSILAINTDENQPIAILLDHDAPMLVAILGVLKAGRSYVILELSQPESRLTSILDDAQAECLIVNDDTSATGRDLGPRIRQVINLDKVDGSLSHENLGVIVSPDKFACILYTSGSSGQPKGVIQNHRNVVRNASLYASGCRIQPQDRITLFAALSTGQGTPTVFSALFSGAAILPYNIRQNGVSGLGDWLNRQGVTIYISAPTLFRQFSATLNGSETFPNLRLIRLGAEQIQKGDVELYKKHFSLSCTFAAFLSSTETGNICQYQIDRDTVIRGQTVPAGYPVEGVEIVLIDEGGNPVGFDEPGEIVVKSRYLSPGYWRDPELTERSFFADPKGGDKRIYRTGDLGRIASDGCLVHLGRKDFQTKIRGYRIEIGEIETALLAHGEIKEVAVVAQVQPTDKPVTDFHRSPRLIAYVVPRRATAPTISALRQFLDKKLPRYMIPDAFVLLQTMPLTPAGKTDRRALPDSGKIRPDIDTPYKAPQTAVEKFLAQSWADILSLDEVGVHDNFFDLGGHSLAAMRIISLIIRQFDLEISMQCLLAAPTIAELAALIDEQMEKKIDEELLDQVVNQVDALTDTEAQDWLGKSGGVSLVDSKDGKF